MALMIRRPVHPQEVEDFFRFPRLWDELDMASPFNSGLDLYETPESVVAEVAVPGLNPEDIAINLVDNILTISGETKTEKKEGREYHQRELRYGKFSQSVALPTAVQADKAEASFKHGILTVTLPKAEEAKPKQIKIKLENK